jgi:hypothetical protein
MPAEEPDEANPQRHEAIKQVERNGDKSLTPSLLLMADLVRGP